MKGLEFTNVQVWCLVILVIALLFIFSGCNFRCGGSSSDFRWTRRQPTSMKRKAHSDEDDLNICMDDMKDVGLNVDNLYCGSGDSVRKVVNASGFSDCCWRCAGDSGCTGTALIACQRACEKCQYSNSCGG